MFVLPTYSSQQTSSSSYEAMQKLWQACSSFLVYSHSQVGFSLPKDGNLWLLVPLTLSTLLTLQRFSSSIHAHMLWILFLPSSQSYRSKKCPALPWASLLFLILPALVIYCSAEVSCQRWKVLLNFYVYDLSLLLKFFVDHWLKEVFKSQVHKALWPDKFDDVYFVF